MPITEQGSQTIIWTYDDGNGNIASQSQNVIIEDTTEPEISCPADFAVEATSATGAIVTFDLPEFSDNCTGASLKFVSGLESGAIFPIEETIVTYQVEDAVNNTDQCSFTVTVTGVAPVIECPGNITMSVDNETCSTISKF